MRALLILMVLLCLSGCSAMNFNSAERWVTGTTVYSTKLPSLEISVDPSFYYVDAPEDNKVISSNNGRYRTGQNIEWFYFKDRLKQKSLNVKISNLDSNGRIYFILPDYSESETLYLSSSQDVGGMTLKTNILSIDYHGTPCLLKAYGKLLGDTTKFQIFYLEKVSKSWLNKSSYFLSQQDHDKLNEFNNRADNAFSLTSYSGVTPPSQESK
jgi:hypothetical protein